MELKERISLLIKRDLLYIIVIVFCLGACLYTLYNVGSHVDSCNDQWIAWVEDKCVCRNQAQGLVPIDYNYIMEGYNGTEDRDTDTARQG